MLYSPHFYSFCSYHVQYLTYTPFFSNKVFFKQTHIGEKFSFQTMNSRYYSIIILPFMGENAPTAIFHTIR